MNYKQAWKHRRELSEVLEKRVKELEFFCLLLEEKQHLKGKGKMNVKVIIDKEKKKDLIEPLKMFDKNVAYGTIFRGFFRDRPNRDFFVSCGPHEDGIIHIWYNDEEQKYQLNVDTPKSVSEYVESYKVFKIDGEIEFSLSY
jgi:hypothetical protein